MIYELLFTKEAEKDIKVLKRNEPQAYKKLLKLLAELIEHPKTGTGEPEQLKYELSGRWARRINKKDRIVYKIDDTKVIVTVLSAKGHYYDK